MFLFFTPWIMKHRNLHVFFFFYDIYFQRVCLPETERSLSRRKLMLQGDGAAQMDGKVGLIRVFESTNGSVSSPKKHYSNDRTITASSARCFADSN